MERNLRIYGLYLRLSRVFFWAPVFFFYFSQRFTLAQILQLEAVYYISVVVLEVPSGYLSDRVGRTPTLRLGAIAGLASYTLFLTGGSSFVRFALAQALLAAWFAFRSGTDVSFHYDALRELERSDEFPTREQRLTRDSYLVSALSSIAGGLMALIDLRVVYLASIVVSSAELITSFTLREPGRAADDAQAFGFLRQLRACGDYLRVPALAWLFCFMTYQLIVHHIP